MGICSAVAAGVSAVAGVFSSVCSFVGGAATSIGSVVGGAVSTIGTFVGKIGSTIGDKAIEIAKMACRTCDIVGKINGVLKENERTEDLGERVLYAEDEGIRPENYPKYDAYLEEIRNLELDPEKTTKYKTWEKQLAGGLVVDKCISQINPNLETCSLWIPAALGKIGDEKLKAWTEIAKKNNIPLASVSKFLMGDAADMITPDVKQFQKANSDQGRDVVLAAERVLNPNLERSDIYAKIDSIRAEVEKGMREFEMMK